MSVGQETKGIGVYEVGNKHGVEGHVHRGGTMQDSARQEALEWKGARAVVL
jgi:hypothetical protein